MHKILSVVFFLGICCGSAHAEHLSPLAFPSLGPLPAGSFTIDTSGASLTFAGNPGGVIHPQGPSLPEIAVFTFNGGATLAAADTITISGDRPAALLFQGPATLAGTIDAQAAGGGIGGAGGDPFSGMDPTGFIGSSGAGSGAGFGGGTIGSGGGGGSFGGPGGGSTRPTYGDLQTALEAGSGGGGGAGNFNDGSAGGAGGGGIEIGALGTLSFIGGSVDAGGANGAGGIGTSKNGGGGGSGGGIFLHAFDITLDGTTQLLADGGRGGSAFKVGVLDAGDGGGGGRIAILTNDAGQLTDVGATLSAAGGAGGVEFFGTGPVGNGVAGSEGLVLNTTDSSVGLAVPEPSSMALMLLGAILLLFQRRRSH